MREMMQMDGMGMGGIGMMLVMALFWVLVIAGVVWLIWRLFRGRSSSGGGGDTT